MKCVSTMSLIDTSAQNRYTFSQETSSPITINHVSNAGSSRDDIFPSRVDDRGWDFVYVQHISYEATHAELLPQPQISPGFASDEDADLADELLIGFEEGVPWN